MPNLILKAASANIKRDNSDLNIGRTNSDSATKPLLVKAKPGIFYRLVDEKTGQIVKTQTLLRKGKNLQVLVDEKAVLELEDFFGNPTDPQTTLASLPGYLVDASTNADTEWGLISPASASTTPVNGKDMVWTTGMPVAHTLEPQAIGLPTVAALSGGSAGMGGLAGLGAIAASAVAGGGSGGAAGGGAAGGGLTALPKIVGTLVAGPVNSNGNGDLTVDAYDSNGNKLGTAEVKPDGSFEITLSRAYSGIVVLKSYDKNPNNTNIPTHLDEATNASKPLTNMLAVLTFSGSTLSGVKITPLTHAASLKAGVTLKADGTPNTADTSSSKIDDANALIAKAFGLKLNTSSLLTADIDTTENQADANAKFNDYGVLLNLFSQMENNGVSMEAIASGINPDGSLSADLMKALNQAGSSALLATDINHGDLLKALSNKVFDLTSKFGTTAGNDIISGGRGDDVLWGRGGGTHTVSLNIIQGSSSTTTTTETADVVFSDGLKVGESVTVGGLTITATASMTSTQVANAFANVAVNATSTTNSAYNATGSMTGWSSGSVTASGVNSVVKFTSSTANANVTDLTASYKLLDNDIFKWASGDAVGSTTPVDVIKDFTEWGNSSGDRLDILGLLTGYTSGTSILSDWVTVALNQTAPNTSTANSTKIDIDIDGLGTGTAKQIIWLEGFTLSTTDVAVLKANGVLMA